MARVDINGQLTGEESLMIQSMADGSYFYENDNPTGDINGINQDFDLTATPNPSASCVVFLNGAFQTPTIDYTISGNTITMVVAPPTDSILRANYRVDPN